MSRPDVEIGLPEALERAASALPRAADAIRPANGDPGQLARELSGADASTVLAWLLEHEPAAGEELALAWAEDPETAGPVLRLSPESLPKPARKALRRALHHLRSRGMDVPAPAPAATVATLAPLDEGIDEARVTAFDPHGVRIVYLASDRAGGGVRLFELALDEVRGVLEFEVYEAGRSRARRFLRDAAQRETWPAVPAPSASVRALIARAAAHQASDRSVPRQFGEWRTRLSEVPAGTQTPGAIARDALAGTAVDLALASGWVRDGGLGPWPPPIERVQPLIEKLDEIAKSVVIVTGAARREQVDRAVEDSLDAIYAGDERGRIADLFEETAYVWWRSGREADARQAVAVAADFRERAARENPVARAMIERLLAPALTRARAEGGEAPAAAEPASLIARP
jgi:hypothetical protein